MVSPSDRRDARVPIGRVWEWLAGVPDPAMPYISVVDLGIVREVRWDDARLLVVTTPTWCACPAKVLIDEAIRDVLNDHGIECVTVESRLAPAWTTEWISAAGKAKLAAAGIALPLPPRNEWQPLRRLWDEPACPHCGARATRVTSEFGSTLCKSMHTCSRCLNAFEYFKSL